MYYASLIIFGLIFGSFIASFTWRIGKEISLKLTRSICPHCEKKIFWFDNIPLLSFFLLKGKCRNCKKKISLRYPVIELATALGFLKIGYFLKLCPKFSSLNLSPICSLKMELGSFSIFFILFIFVLLFSILIIDFEHQVIPDEISFILFGIILIKLLFISYGNFYVHLASGFFSALFLLLVHLITKGKGMGLGDVKFALFPGAFFGWPLALVWMFVSFLTGAAIGGIMVLLGKAHFGKHIAFGPFLIISFFITLIWGNSLVRFIFP